MISVIMSAYNEEKEWLEASIESILTQTYSDFEFIITLDNPKNKVLEDVIKKYIKQDNRIIFIKNESNIGLTNCLNNMLEIVKGDFVARMDADDIAYKNRFEEQIKYMNKNNLDICGANVIQFYENKDLNIIKNPSSYENIKKYIYLKNCVAHPTFLVKKKVYKILKGYNEVPTCEDYDFLLRAINHNFKIGNIPKVLLRYRLSPNSISRKNLGKQVVLSNYISDFYRKNKNQIITKDMINQYINKKNYQRKVKKYDKYCFKKNQLLKYKNTNKILYCVYLFRTLCSLNLFIENIYIRKKLKSILNAEQRKDI